MTEELAFASVDRLQELIAAGEISVTEVAESCLTRIEALNPAGNAVVAMRAEPALAEASAADRVPVAERGPLHGVPFRVKDVTETLDLPTTWGSRVFEGNMTGFEAVTVAHPAAGGRHPRRQDPHA